MRFERNKQNYLDMWDQAEKDRMLVDYYGLEDRERKEHARRLSKYE
jgi:hypothetical protein